MTLATNITTHNTVQLPLPELPSPNTPTTTSDPELELDLTDSPCPWDDFETQALSHHEVSDRPSETEEEPKEVSLNLTGPTSGLELGQAQRQMPSVGTPSESESREESQVTQLKRRLIFEWQRERSQSSATNPVYPTLRLARLQVRNHRVIASLSPLLVELLNEANCPAGSTKAKDKVKPGEIYQPTSPRRQARNRREKLRGEFGANVNWE